MTMDEWIRIANDIKVYSFKLKKICGFYLHSINLKKKTMSI